MNTIVRYSVGGCYAGRVFVWCAGGDLAGATAVHLRVTREGTQQ